MPGLPPGGERKDPLIGSPAAASPGTMDRTRKPERILRSPGKGVNISLAPAQPRRWPDLHAPMPPPDSPLRPAVFLDRDGTLNVPVVTAGLPEPPRSLAAFQLFPDAAAGCRTLAEAGYVLVVVTNQPDVGRGTLAAEVVEAQHRQLRQWIPELARIEVCYDSGRDPATASPRRKPEPGMILDAAVALGLDLSRSWLIGDRWRDVDCGHRAGVRTIFIDLGHAESLRSPPHFTVRSFGEAVAVVLREPNRPATPPSGGA